jgi:hypothetical protein
MPEKPISRAQIEEWNRNRYEALNAKAMKLLATVDDSTDVQNLQGLVAFWETEAKQWRELFEQQRGGKTFVQLQFELIALRYENRQLKEQAAGNVQ